MHNMRALGVNFVKTVTVRSMCTTMKCSKCGQLLPAALFRCTSCSALQRVSRTSQSMNLFQALGHSPGYDVDQGQLKAAFRKLQSKFHPDKFSRESSDERDKSEEISSFLNKAYFTLTDPYERGMYLLRLKGVDPEEGDIQLAGEFLTRVMEINERLEEIQSQKDLTELESDNESRIGELSKTVSEAFRANHLSQAKISLQQMKYFISIRERIRKLKNEM